MKITFSRAEIKSIIVQYVSREFDYKSELVVVESDYTLPSFISVDLCATPEQSLAKRLVEGEE